MRIEFLLLNSYKCVMSYCTWPKHHRHTSFNDVNDIVLVLNTTVRNLHCYLTLTWNKNIKQKVAYLCCNGLYCWGISLDTPNSSLLLFISIWMHSLYYCMSLTQHLLSPAVLCSLVPLLLRLSVAISPTRAVVSVSLTANHLLPPWSCSAPTVTIIGICPNGDLIPWTILIWHMISFSEDSYKWRERPQNVYSVTTKSAHPLITIKDINFLMESISVITVF